MNKLIYSLLVVCSVLCFSSCEDETSQDPSVITYYATLELQGDATVFWPKGQAWVDPGYTSEMKGEDVTDQVEADVPDVNTPGVYDLTYSIVNEDGFAVYDSRRVIIYDATDDRIGGITFWTLDNSLSFRNYEGTISKYKGAFEIYIIAKGDNEYIISDFLAGWYDQGAGYGDAYTMKGTFKLNDDNTITPLSGSVAGWGDSMDGMDSAVFNPETGTISYNVAYAGMTFTVVLNMNE